MSVIQFQRIHSEDAGRSSIEDASVGLMRKDYAPPAPPLYTSLPEEATQCLFLELPAGWVGEWHPTPVRQWLIVLSGRGLFEGEDGSTRQFRAGDCILLEDIEGKGHRTTVTGKEAVRMMAVHLP
ncbi:MAG: cupin domain-containing protein [Rhodobiaceae bacterium]|nr:cupin domain-containing protein [Rhodobiaceae bacterium]